MQTLKPFPPRPAPQALIDQIIKDALRGAALAPTYIQALDITGAALIAVSYLVNRRSEGSFAP